MISLKQYLQECGDGAATPGNTMGMGNPMAPGPDGEVGSGDTFDHQGKKAKLRRKKKKVVEGMYADSIHEGMFDVEDSAEQGFETAVIERWLKDNKRDFQSDQIILDNNQLILDVRYLGINYDLVKSYPLARPLDLIKTNNTIVLDHLNDNNWLKKITKCVEAPEIYIKNSYIKNCKFKGDTLEAWGYSILTNCQFGGSDGNKGIKCLNYTDPYFDGDPFETCKVNLNKNCRISIKCPQTSASTIIDILKEILDVPLKGWENLKRKDTKSKSFIKPILKRLNLDPSATGAAINIYLEDSDIIRINDDNILYG